MSSRDKILIQLREGKLPFSGISKPDSYRAMVPIDDKTQPALQSQFIEQAQMASCVVYQAMTPEEAIETVLTLIGEEKTISSWDPEHIPIPELAEVLDNAGITCIGQDANVRIGLTGIDAALAATGSIVMLSGEGRFRASSLLPSVHIAVMTAEQIMPDLESWWAKQKNAGLERLRQHSNIVVITGPSRTADIAMELVMGMHGPRELHVVILE
jgi:L-lactate dehydrogenase complex protein LldG